MGSLWVERNRCAWPAKVQRIRKPWALAAERRFQTFPPSFHNRGGSTQSPKSCRRCARNIGCHRDLCVARDLFGLCIAAETGPAASLSRPVRHLADRYLVGRRLERVRAEIAHGTSLADAAYAVGFADQSHMTRHFRARFGPDPRPLRLAFARW